MNTTTQLPPAAATFGGRVKQARQWSGLTQGDFARAVKASRTTVSSWENGHTSPTILELQEIARATKFPAGWFVEDAVTERQRSARSRHPPLPMAA